MDIIFQLVGSLMVCYYVLKRGNKDFILQSYSTISNGKFNYEKTYKSVQEVYLTKIGIIHITFGYLLAFMKVPNFLERFSTSTLNFYIFNLLAIIFLFSLMLFIVRTIAKFKTKSIKEKFDYNKDSPKDSEIIYIQK